MTTNTGCARKHHALIELFASEDAAGTTAGRFERASGERTRQRRLPSSRSEAGGSLDQAAGRSDYQHARTGRNLSVMLARPFAADAWTTRRARDILCFIASRSHRRASKDTIIDTFWGETEIPAVEKNFHPTISHIRKALNSNQPLKQNFILYRDGDYQLNPELSYRIDIEEFDQLVTRGESARRARQFDQCESAFEQAVELYRGDFAQGSYEPWVDEQRSYYREKYLHLLESLAVVAQKQARWSRSLQLAQSILHEDPFREDVHCAVMRAHVNLGDRGAAKDRVREFTTATRARTWNRTKS